MNLKFYSYDDMRADPMNEGRVLLRVLAKTEPDTFSEALGHLLLGEGKTEYNDSISGLLVKRNDKTVVSVMSIKDVKIDRIYTLPRFRRQGHAKTFLSLLTAFSMGLGFSFTSPVNPEIVPVFLSAGWERKGAKFNRDGTVDMVSNPRRCSSTMDVTRWAVALEGFNEVGSGY
jgi:hypothetical protein